MELPRNPINARTKTSNDLSEAVSPSQPLTLFQGKQKVCTGEGRGRTTETAPVKREDSLSRIKKEPSRFQYKLDNHSLPYYYI